MTILWSIDSRDTWRPNNRLLWFIVYKTNKKYYEISTSYNCIESNSTLLGYAIWIINFKFNWTIYDLSRIMQICEFDAVDKSKISCDWYRIQSDINHYPLSFFANTPLNYRALFRSQCQICPENKFSYVI